LLKIFISTKEATSTTKQWSKPTFVPLHLLISRAAIFQTSFLTESWWRILPVCAAGLEGHVYTA